MNDSAILKRILAYWQQIAEIGKDPRLYASHVSLYTSLFVCWQQNGFVNPFPINRKQVMSFGKIASIATYHKCMNDLDKYCYLRYQPSYHPTNGSLVYWIEDNSQ